MKITRGKVVLVAVILVACLVGCKPNTKNAAQSQVPPTSSEIPKSTALATAITEGLELEDTVQSEEDGTRYVVGTISNHRDSSFRKVTVEIDLLSQSGSKLGSTSYVIEKMEPATRRSFKAVIEPREAEGFRVTSVKGEE